MSQRYYPASSFTNRFEDKGHGKAQSNQRSGKSHMALLSYIGHIPLLQTELCPFKIHILKSYQCQNVTRAYKEVTKVK